MRLRLTAIHRLLLVTLILAASSLASPVARGDAPAARPSPEHWKQLREALQLAETNQPERAVKLLNDALPKMPMHAARHGGELLRSSLNGSYRVRQAYWRQRRIVDTVVLVPDKASFIDAVKQWPLDRYWPVLIEDAWFTPMFVESFKPAQIVRWQREDKLSAAALAKHIEDAAGKQNDLLGHIKRPFPDPGLVVIDADAPQAPAGIALAAGRGQPVLLIEAPPKATGESVEALRQTIEQELVRRRIASDQQWAGLTLAAEVPFAYPHGKPGSQKPFATADLLGRTGSGVRIAVAGHLMPDAVQSVYQAMCGLFLQPKNVGMINSYSTVGRPWGRYNMSDAERALKQRYQTTLLQGRTATQPELAKLVERGNPFDMVWINSAGGSTRWKLTPGNATSAQMPVGRAAAIHMVHSFSAQRPLSDWTIAGMALDGGAYWFYGSVHEPYLHAFVTPTGMANKVMAGTPLAFAARRLPGEVMYAPWKLTVIGDPLFALHEERPERLEADAMPGAPVKLNEQDPLPRRYLDALLTGSDQAPALAGALLADGVNPQRDVLTRVAFELIRAEQQAPLAAAAPMRSPGVARALQVRALRHSLDQALADGDHAHATDLVDKLIAQEVFATGLSARLDRWIAAMQGHGQQKVAVAYLRAKLEEKLSSSVQREIEAALARYEQANH